MPALPTPTKIDLTPRKHHGFSVVLFFLGMLFPPLAVAARFGIGGDFWLNLLLTICGYIPGHGHNFYIQNIRNNKNNRRTPKWAQRYGLVDTSEIKRKQKKSQWANRYNDRLPESTLADAPYEEGQEMGSSVNISSESGHRTQPNGELWRPEDESFYGGANANGAGQSSASGGRWHYPANFEDTIPAEPSGHEKKKKKKKDRFARTEDAYSVAETQGGSRRRKSKKKRSRAAGDDASYAESRRSEDTSEFPEDPAGGLYGPGPGERERDGAAPNGGARTNDEELFTHEF